MASSASHAPPVQRVASVARRMRGERGRVREFERAFHRCAVPMVIVDNERRYADANLGARLLFRLSLAELRRRGIDNLTPARGLAKLESVWAKLLAEGEVTDRFDVRLGDGDELQIVFYAVANVLPGRHLIVFAPAWWEDDELGTMARAVERSLPARLSPREREVLTLIADGLSLPQIADRLIISPTTARTHAAHVYEKLGARNRAHAVALALQLGLIELTDADEGGASAEA